MKFSSMILALLLLAPLGACKGAPAPEPAAATTLAEIGPVTPLPTGFQRGFCFAHSWDSGGQNGYGSDASLASKRELLTLGANWVSITPFGFQSSLESPEVQRIRRRQAAAETDERLTREIQQAHDLKMKVMLKPHLWIGHDAWQGHLKPLGGSEEGWTAWFASYSDFILHYAQLAQQLRVDAFVIGTELSSSAMSPARADDWRALIQRIRAVYKGPLTYAANWNEAEGVTFWDDVDWIGVQFYPPLTQDPHAPYEALYQGAAQHLDSYVAISRKHSDKPIILTEVGYKSIVATAVSPSTWPEQLPEDDKRYDERSQALAFRALLNAAAERPAVQGLHVWKWFSWPDTDEEGSIGFAPRKKLAAGVIQKAFSP